MGGMYELHGATEEESRNFRSHPGWDDKRDGDPCRWCGTPRILGKKRPCPAAPHTSTSSSPGGSTTEAFNPEALRSHGAWDVSRPGWPCGICGTPRGLGDQIFCTGRVSSVEAANGEVMRLLALVAEGRNISAQGGDLSAVFAQARPLVIAQVDGLCAGVQNLSPAGKKALRAMGIGPEAARRMAEALLGIFADEELRV